MTKQELIQKLESLKIRSDLNLSRELLTDGLAGEVAEMLEDTLREVLKIIKEAKKS